MSDLFAYQHPAKLPDTSIAAIASISRGLGKITAIVLAAIRNAGPLGLTTNELATVTNIDRGTVQPRTSELKLLGLIRDSGQRRANRNGKKAIVWVAVEGRSNG